MARTIIVDGVDRTSIIRLASFNLGTAAFRGQVGTGGFDLDDPAAVIDIEPLKLVTVAEGQSSPTRILTGYTAERGIQRGPLRAGTQRQWDVTVEDLNVIFDDRLIGASGKRPEETDRARVMWLITSGALGAVTAGQVPNTATKVMDEEDYRGRRPRDVMEDCSQRTGKNFYIYDEGSGRRLFYDKQSNADTCPISISSDLSDVNDVTVFAPGSLDVRKDPERVYHRINLVYKGGAITRGTNPGGRVREKRVVNKRIRTLRAAKDHIETLLEQCAEETVQISVELDVPNTVIGDIRAGMKIPLKLPHVGLTDYTNYKIAETQAGPAIGEGGYPTDVRYVVRLTMADEIRPTHVQDVGGPAGVPDDEKGTAGGGTGGGQIVDGAEYYIDDYDRTAGLPGARGEASFTDEDNALNSPLDLTTIPIEAGDRVFVYIQTRGVDLATTPVGFTQLLNQLQSGADPMRAIILSGIASRDADANTIWSCVVTAVAGTFTLRTIFGSDDFTVTGIPFDVDAAALQQALAASAYPGTPTDDYFTVTGEGTSDEPFIIEGFGTYAGLPGTISNEGTDADLTLIESGSGMLALALDFAETTQGIAYVDVWNAPGEVAIFGGTGDDPDAASWAYGEAQVEPFCFAQEGTSTVPAGYSTLLNFNWAHGLAIGYDNAASSPVDPGSFNAVGETSAVSGTVVLFAGSLGTLPLQAATGAWWPGGNPYRDVTPSAAVDDFGVDGDALFVEADSEDATLTTYVDSADGALPTEAPAWTLTGLFDISVAGDTGEAGERYFDLGIGDMHVIVYFGDGDHAAGIGLTGQSVQYAAKAVAAATLYRFRLTKAPDSLLGALAVTLWEDGDPEPAPDLIGNLPDDTAGDRIDWAISVGNETGAAQRFSLYELKLALLGTGGDTVTGALVGLGDGTTTAYAIPAWRQGTLVIRVSGIVVEPLTADPAAGTFTLDAAPAVGARIVVSYEAV